MFNRHPSTGNDRKLHSPKLAPRAALICLSLGLSVCASLRADPITFNDQATFQSSAGNLTLESYESVPTGGVSNPLVVDTSPLTTTVSGGGGGGQVVNTSFSGLFATDGSVYLTAGGRAVGGPTITFDFDSPINSFGVNFTDFGDFVNPGTLSYSLDGGTPVVFASSPLANGNQLFFGVIDDMNSFSQVAFTSTASGDGFGFDEVRFGVTEVPEPTSLLAFGLGFFGLTGYALRRKRRAVRA